MRRKLLFVVAIIAFTVIAAGSIAVAKDKASSFDKKHQDASVLFLICDTEIRINKDWSYVTKVHKRAKVLKEDAQDMGEIPIYYDNNRQKVIDLEAFTLTPDNRKHPYSKIQDLNIYDGYPMYSDSKVKIITLPQVTVGAILDHKFTVESKGLPIKGAFWCQFFVDSPAPMKELRLSITMPKSLGINYKEFGLTRKPKITQDKENITYSWVVKNIEPNEDMEDFLPPPTPESIKEGVEFSSIRSWKEVSNWYSILVKKNLKITPEIEKAVVKLTKGKTTIKDKTRAILEYVQKDFRYVSMSFGDNTLESHPTDEVFKNKYGDCKDLSLLCKAMLSVAGIKSSVCLFNTEFSLNDPQYDLPIPSLFDHVILLVEDPQGENFYIDPVLKGYDIGEFPMEYQGAYTFVINDSGGKFVKFTIFGEERYYISSNSIATIKEDGSALVEAESTWDLDSSIGLRRKFNNLTKKKKNELSEIIDAYLVSGGQMIKKDILGLEKEYGIIKISTTMKIKDEYPITDGVMIIDVAGFERGMDFTKKKRVNPIFYPLNSVNEEVVTYRIPKGYFVSYVPENLNLDNGFFSIKRDYIKGQNEVKVTEIARYKRKEISNKEYDKIKDFYDKLPTLTQQRIIIKRKGGSK